jgi:ATPase subunit of ABC transporter with duplicated ATPase domains
VLSQVGLLEFVKSNPKGLDLDLGINGNVISGGEKQRLCLARILLSEPEILLLDEPTDNLDLESAEALERALDAFEGTVLAVTHDRWFSRTMDRFVVFGSDSTVRESDEPVWDEKRAKR